MIKQALVTSVKIAAQNKTAALPIQHTLNHATSADNFRKILSSGKLMPISEIAKHLPDSPVEVERALTSFSGRETLNAAEAVKAMAGRKSIDKIFLTKDGYLPHYGDFVISRKAYLPSKNTALNLVPDEYISSKSIDITDPSVSMFVPDEQLSNWQKEFPGLNLLPKSSFTGRRLSRLDGAMQLPDKALNLSKDTRLYKLLSDAGLLSSDALAGAGLGVAANYALSDDSDLTDSLLAALAGAGAGATYRSMRGLGGFFGNKKLDPEILNGVDSATAKRIFGNKAVVAGSRPMGTDIGGSDTDIFVPYSSDYFFNRAISDMAENPSFIPSKLNAVRPDKQVFTYAKDGKDIDIVLGRGNKAFEFREAFNEAMKNLTDEQRAAIIAEKARLKKAWLLRNYRYKRYKNQLAEEMGLAQHYF